MLKKFFNEFKEFAFKGNVIDLAIGVVIGGAFSGIVKAVVDDLINPIVGLFMFGNLDHKTLKIDALNIIFPYGHLVSAFITFLLTALVLFLFVKFLNNYKKKPEALPTEPPAQEKLLAEIRDLLKDKK